MIINNIKIIELEFGLILHWPLSQKGLHQESSFSEPSAKHSKNIVEDASSSSIPLSSQSEIFEELFSGLYVS